MASPIVPAMSGGTPALATRRICASKDGMSRIEGQALSRISKYRAYQGPPIEGGKKMELGRKYPGSMSETMDLRCVRRKLIETNPISIHKYSSYLPSSRLLI